MVNSHAGDRVDTHRALTAAVALYVIAAGATVGVLAVLVGVAPAAATREAWVHAVIVAVFAVVLPLRLRAARAGSSSALRAVGVICGVLVVVNAAEAAIPGAFPAWMRMEMVALALLMAACCLFVFRIARSSSRR
jgi:hypothetical protein